MIAFLRFFIPLLIVQTVAYAFVAISARLRQRRRLQAEWEDAGQPGARDDFVDRGMDEFEDTLRYRLLLAIYVVPWVALAAIVYWVNR